MPPQRPERAPAPLGSPPAVRGVCSEQAGGPWALPFRGTRGLMRTPRLPGEEKHLPPLSAGSGQEVGRAVRHQVRTPGAMTTWRLLTESRGHGHVFTHTLTLTFLPRLQPVHLHPAGLGRSHRNTH